MEMSTSRYAALLADAASVSQIKDALERAKSDAETISTIRAIIKDGDAIRSAVGALK